MEGMSIIGFDLAKRVFQVHGINARQEVVVQTWRRRSKVLIWLSKIASCIVGIAARVVERLQHVLPDTFFFETAEEPFLAVPRSMGSADSDARSTSRPSQDHVLKVVSIARGAG